MADPLPADRVFVHDLRLRARHGVLPEETVLGQTFHLDIDCRTSHAKAAASDAIDDAVSYADLCAIAAEISDAGPYKLIETLAERIAFAVLERFPAVASVRVQIRKPGAPIDAHFGHVGVEVTRARRG